VRFILEEPFAPFLESLMTGILPAHIWNNVPAQNMNLSEYNLKPIGSGPYQFKSLTKDNKTGQIRSYQLERNDNYYTESAKIEKINFKFYASFDEAIDALNNKNIQAISFLPHEKIDQVLSERSLNFHLLNLPQYTALFFNKNNNSILKSIKIRKIISHAIDKDKIIKDILQAQAQRIDGPLLPGQLGYTDDFPKYPFDIDHAKKELENMGWKLADYEVASDEEAVEGEESVAPVTTYPFQVRKKDDQYLEFNLTTVNQTENVKIAEMIKKNLQQIGIKTNIILFDPENIQREVIKTRNYEILLYGEILGFDPDPYAFWHSSQVEHPGLNLSLFANQKADELLEAARKTTDQETRIQKYQEFQKLIADEVPAIFLFNQTYTYPQTTKIQGFAAHTIFIPANRFANIHQWYIKAKRSFD
jgi:peptide/nickel transport system substrate-binding protein